MRGYPCSTIAKNLVPCCALALCERTSLIAIAAYSMGRVARSQSIQTTVWILLAAFSQIYSENQEQKEKNNMI
jgi:hypothetical protein